MRLFSFAACLLACHLLFAATLARAGDSLPVIDLQHTSWTAREGAPTGVTAIAQTADGWLWIGSSVGLFRFDGVRFERMAGAQAPLSSSIHGLGLLPDGRLWITYKFGGASLMSSGGMRHFRVGEHGMPGGTAQGMGQDGQGRIWLGSAGGLKLLAADGNWRNPAPDMAAPPGVVLAMLLDRSGVFWIRTAQAVYRLSAQGARFEQGAAVAGFGLLAQHPDGSIWASSSGRAGLQLVAGVPGPATLGAQIDTKVTYFLFDSSGNLWQPNYSGVGYVRATGTGRVRQTGAGQGLSGAYGYAVFEDREHNIWVGTENGLDRFRPYRLRPLELPKYLGGARPLAARGAGGVWIDRSFLADARAPGLPYAPPSTGATLTTALHVAPDGALWNASLGALWRIAGGERAAVPLPAALADAAASPILSMATDETGALWASFGRRGLYALRGGVWRENGGLPGLAGLLPPVIASDAAGRIWFGATNDRLVLLERGRLRTVSRAQGLRLGTVLAILPMAQGAWIGGENGVARVDGDKVTSITGHGDDPFAGATGLVLSPDGTLWINGGDGISSIAPAELQRALREPGYRVQFERLDYRDGLQGTASPITPFPSAVRSADGQLWFSTLGGVYAFDPAALPRNTVVPPVYITALKAGGQDYPVRDGLRLPPHAGELSIDFTALSLRAPERMRLRYRLDGLDHDWHEVAGRRSVQYTGLAPGRYRFRVIASNDDGVWNDAGAQLSFDLLPGVAQSTWFRVLCVLAALLLAWLLHRWRLARLTAQLQLRMNERLGERTRIARALHDTILQSMQGIILHMHVARGALPEGNAVRARLGQVIDDADQAYIDGRDQLSVLRLGRAHDIEDVIADTGECLMRDYPRTAFRLQSAGKPVLLCDIVAEELVEVAREALRNAFQHAGASHVDVTLEFGLRWLTLGVRDDGKGMAADAGIGRWGLVGMRERVARIRGTLLIDGAAAPGTRIVVKLPARLAYARGRRWWRRR